MEIVTIQRRNFKMSKRVIVNADDFGLSEAVNHGILKAHKKGIVTSTTIMANMPGFHHGIEIAKANPDLHVGVHLTLTAYKPVLQDHKHIVTEDGYFRKQGEISQIDTNEAYRELKAQIDKVLNTGLKIDHLDSHHHIHTLPVLKNVIERLQQEYHLPIRGGFTYDTPIQNKTILLDQFYDEGVTTENFHKMMSELEDGKTYDLMCHPAFICYFLYHITSYSMKRIDELHLLCSEEFRQIINEEQIELITYDQL